MFMSRKDSLPTPPRRRVWRDGEQRHVIGTCLRDAFVAEEDHALTALLAALPDGMTRKDRSR